MIDQTALLTELAPIILLLVAGIVAAVASRTVGLNPVVGYLLLGVLFKAGNVMLLANSGTVATLAELGVVFLLFDIGLHFSLEHVRIQARDIFLFGPLQIVLAAVAIGGLAILLGLSPLGGLIVGTTLALSSTAVVAGLIAERHQQNCPVGLTATAILIFQDIAAILLLVVVGSLGTGASLLPAIGGGIAKAVLGFVIAVALARTVVRPLFNLVARGRNEEVFTAMALAVALAAAWATGMVGLSLTLGAFLAGMIIAETPYRAIIQAEIKPFRGLLLGFFFVSVGLSLDLGLLLRAWPAVLGITVALLVIKIATNAASSLAFRWSVPGSLQLGFLIAQGSEFAFVIFALPSVRALVGENVAAMLICAVAISLAVTPSLAQSGRVLAGRLRLGMGSAGMREVEERDLNGPVFIAGMGTVGRAVADALIEFDLGYAAVERDDRRLREAVADGYKAVFGNFADPRIWESLTLHGRRLVVLTAPSFETFSSLSATRDVFFPELIKVAVVSDEAEAERFRSLGVIAVIDRSTPPGLDVAARVLELLGLDPPRIGQWMRNEQERALSGVSLPAL